MNFIKNIPITETLIWLVVLGMVFGNAINPIASIPAGLVVIAYLASKQITRLFTPKPTLNPNQELLAKVEVLQSEVNKLKVVIGFNVNRNE